MKKKFLALLSFLQGVCPDGVAVRKTQPNAKLKGIFVINPLAFDNAELERLVADYKPELEVRYQDKPRQDKASGRWFDPMLFIGEAFPEDSDDDLYDVMKGI